MATFKIDFGSGFDVTESPADEFNIELDVTESPFSLLALLGGRAGGQSLYGGTAANENLVLGGTINATHTTSIISMLDHVQLATGKAIKDGSGNDRITLAAATPHVTLAGDVVATGANGFKATGTGAAVYGFKHTETYSVASPYFLGVDIEPTLTASSGNALVYGVYGVAQCFSANALTGHILYGLNFQAAAAGSLTSAASWSSTTATLYGGYAIALGSVGKAADSGYTKTQTITDMVGFAGQITLQATSSGVGTGTSTLNATTAAGLQVSTPTFSAPATGTRSVVVGTAGSPATGLYGLRVKGYTTSQPRVTVYYYYGVRVEDFTATLAIAPTMNALLEIGTSTPTATSGLLRFMGNFSAAANRTPLYISEGATPTLRQLRTMDPGAGGANFAGGELVCVLV